MLQRNFKHIAELRDCIICSAYFHIIVTINPENKVNNNMFPLQALTLDWFDELYNLNFHVNTLNVCKSN